MSWAVTAAAVTRPRPSRENTVSTTTEPAISCPASSPTTVSAGSDALRSACRRWIRSLPAPLARAVSTYAWSRAVSRLLASTCATCAPVGIASVSAGSTRPRNPSLPNAGNHRSRKENSSTSSSPTQKVGTDTPSGGSDSSSCRSHRCEV